MGDSCGLLARRAWRLREQTTKGRARTLGCRGGTMADDPVRKRSRRAGKRVERQRRKPESQYLELSAEPA